MWWSNDSAGIYKKKINLTTLQQINVNLFTNDRHYGWPVHCNSLCDQRRIQLIDDQSYRLFVFLLQTDGHLEGKAAGGIQPEGGEVPNPTGGRPPGSREAEAG